MTMYNSGDGGGSDPPNAATGNAMPDAVPPAGSKKEQEKCLEIAHKRYSRALELENENRDSALEAIRFRNLEQWNSEVKNAREKDVEGARPCLVVDKTNQYLRQVLNDERQNRPAIKVRPVDDKGDPEVAEVFQGIVRHIEDRSRAHVAYDTAYEAAVDGGFGYFRILTEYCDEMSFEQDIRIERIRNRFQVLLDPERQEPDASDAKWGFVIEKMPRVEYKRKYPNGDALDFDTDGKVFTNWVFKDYIIVAEYFYMEEEEKTLLGWASGQTSIKGKNGITPPQQAVIGDYVVAERKTKVQKVCWKKMTATEILEERDWPGKFIPIVEVVGNELDIEGKCIKSGLLKAAMEPQKIHNYAASSFVENVALAPRAQWVAAEGQIEGYEHLYRSANRRAISVLPYKPVVAEGGVAVPPPNRVAPPGISTGWQQTLMNTEHDIQASMGMYAETTLGIGNAQSGKQELLQQKRGDTATFHFMDNLSLSIQYCGRQLVDLIPKIYDTQRVVRILGEDGVAETAQIDPNQNVAVQEVTQEAGAIKKIYNLNVGKYDVAVTVGPAFTTKRQEAADSMVQIVQAQPELIKVVGDIMFRNMDFPGADEISKRLKKMLPPGIADAGGEDAKNLVQTPQGPIPAEQAGQVIGQMMEQLQAAGEALEKADIMGKENERAKIENDRYKAESDRIKANADAARASAEVAQTTPEAIAALAAQNVLQQLQSMGMLAQQPAPQGVQ